MFQDGCKIDELVRGIVYGLGRVFLQECLHRKSRSRRERRRMSFKSVVGVLKAAIKEKNQWEPQWMTVRKLNAFRMLSFPSQNTNATLLLFLPFLISLAQSSKTSSMYTKGPFLSNIVHKSVWISASQHFSFSGIIQPPQKRIHIFVQWIELQSQLMTPVWCHWTCDRVWKL